MKRNPSESGTRNLADELAELRGLDATTLRQRWRVLYRTEAPVRIGHALLLQAVAYRLQERVLGGLKPSTRRLLERAAEDKVDRRPPTEAPATKVTPGSADGENETGREPAMSISNQRDRQFESTPLRHIWTQPRCKYLSES